VAIARAIVGSKPLLLLDEPTDGLDPVSKARVIEAVRSVARGRTVLVVTHDWGMASVADRVVALTPPRQVQGNARPEAVTTATGS
jgi:ABC-type lipoprotein export system ATPase subunit